ncbi:MAG: DUF3148 domain-containing protein [Synechococcus lacustris]
MTHNPEALSKQEPEQEQASSLAPPFPVGALVRLKEAQPYLKTAAPMPMLRPADLVEVGEQGEVLALRPLEQRAVRFRRGQFLLPITALEGGPEASTDPNGAGPEPALPPDHTH